MFFWRTPFSGSFWILELTIERVTDIARLKKVSWYCSQILEKHIKILELIFKMIIKEPATALPKLLIVLGIFQKS